MPRESIAAPDPVAEIGRRLAEVVETLDRREREKAQAADYAAKLALEQELRALAD